MVRGLVYSRVEPDGQFKSGEANRKQLKKPV